MRRRFVFVRNELLWVLGIVFASGAAELRAQDPPDPEGSAEAEDVASEPSPIERVVLKDGSSIYGSVVSLVDGVLLLETVFGGPIEIQWREVESLTTSRPLHFVLASGSVLVASAAAGDAGTLLLSPVEVEGVSRVDIASIVAINPPPPKPVAFRGSINFGLVVVDGNTSTKSSNLSADFEARSERQRLTLGASFAYAEDSDGVTARNTRGRIKYDFFVTKRFFLFVAALFEEDKFQDIDLRTALSGGPGYQFIAPGDFQAPWLAGLDVHGEIGLAFFDEDRRTGEDERYLSGRWGLNVDWPLLERLSLFHRHEGYPGLENLEDVYITTATGVRISLLENFVATIEVDVDWDNTPAPGRERVDARYLTTLGYTFRF